MPQSASFKVVSRAPDSAGPQLKGVWLDRQAMHAGDKNTVFVQAEDEKSGVSLVSGVFVSPAKAARIGFGCRAGANGTWECPMSPPSCLDCGTWQSEQIQLQDKPTNMTPSAATTSSCAACAEHLRRAVRCRGPAGHDVDAQSTVVSNSQDT